MGDNSDDEMSQQGTNKGQRSRSNSISSMSSIGFSQPDFDEFGNPVPSRSNSAASGGGGGGFYHPLENASIAGSVRSGRSGRSEISFAIDDGDSISKNQLGTFVANGTSMGIYKIAQILNDKFDDLSTQCESENVEYSAELILPNVPSLDKLHDIIDSIIVTDQRGNTSDSSSVFSLASSQTVLTVESVLADLKNPQKVLEILKQKQKTNFTITGEINDLTIALIIWDHPVKSGNSEEFETIIQNILRNNNVYGLIKFCCANGITVPNFQSNEIDFFYYELVCMRMSSSANMLKSAARNNREFLLNVSRTNPVAIEIFKRIYHMLSRQGNGFKVCGVGGNVIKEFCLALRYALRCEEGAIIAKDFNDIFVNADEIAKTKAFVQTQISTIEEFEIWLNFLSDKCSDIDLSVFETPNQEIKSVKMCCDAVGNALGRTLTNIFSNGPNLCEGSVIFLLERIKFKYLCDQHSNFLKECYDRFDGNPVNNYEYTLTQAIKYFPSENWYPQMVSDDDFLKKYPYSGQMNKELYYEIAKLHCVLQKLKLMNSEFTKNISEIIAGIDIENPKPDSHTFSSVRLYTECVCKHAVESLTTLGLRQGCFGNIDTITRCSGPIHEAFVKNMKVGIPGKTMTSILSIMPKKIPLGIAIAKYKNGGQWVPTSSHYCVMPGLECETMNSFYNTQKSARSRLSYNISSTSNLINIAPTLSVNPCGPQDEESDAISVKSSSKKATSRYGPTKIMVPIERGGGGIFSAAALPNVGRGGGGWSLSEPETQESLTKLSHTALLTKCKSNGTNGHTKYKPSNPVNKQELIDLLLAKQDEKGTLSGGSKTRKHRHRKTRKQRRTRRF